MNVQPKESSGSGGETREDAVLRTTAELLSKLPPDYNMVHMGNRMSCAIVCSLCDPQFKVKQQIEKQGGTAPLNVCLRQEVERTQRVLGLVRKTLKDLQLAIAGTIIMSAELQEALNSLYDARVPPRWIKISWMSPTLGYWFTDLLTRINQFSSWLAEGRPACFWLAGFFNPQGFLTAMKQESTRAHKAAGWALDAVTLQTRCSNRSRTGFARGRYIYGLFLEGARYIYHVARLWLSVL